MDSQRPAWRANVAFGLVVIAIFVVAVLLRVPSLYEPYWYGDEGIFAAVAHDVRAGDTLYAGAWDNKPPLIFYTYAAVQASFGTGMFALHAVATAAVLATLALTMWLAFRLYGRSSAAIAGVMFVVLMCTPTIEGNLAMTETFMILPTTGAVCLFVLSRTRTGDVRDALLAASGVCIGVAMLYKQVAAFDGLALVAMIWLTVKAPWRETAAIGAGVALPLIVCAAYFLAAGAFGDFWYAVAGSLPLYGSLGPEGGWLTRVLGLVPAVLMVWWLAGRRRDGLDVGVAQLPVLWLSLAFAGATSSSLEFPHYLQQAAPAFALTIAGAATVGRGVEGDERLALAGAVVVAAAVAYLQFGDAIVERRQVHAVPYYRNHIEYRTGDRTHQEYERFFDGKAEAVRDVAAAIQEDGAGTTLYSWGELPWMHAVGGFDNPTKYYTSFLGELVPGAKDDILRDLDATPPAYILLTSTTYAPFEGLEQWMTGRYVAIEAAGDWRLFRLGTLTGNLAPLDGEAEPESS